MAIIGIQIGSFTASKTVSAGDLTRVLNAYKTIYGQVPSGPPDPVTNITPMRDMTDQETFNKFSSGLLQGMINAVKQTEQQVAAQAAVTVVTSITMA